ncbi:MAG: hypothetical protein NTV94_09885 [Planctomycetota bacterium]|nr:hypothetical protein [Planctomycetota bacterium]
MKTAASLVLLASLTAGLATAASAQTFNRVIGLNGHETAHGIDSTRDGGYVTVGSISNSTVDLGDILVVKYNPDGSSAVRGLMSATASSRRVMEAT